MNRREFNTTAIGAAIATALPLPAIAKPAPASTGPLYAWAAAIARAQNRASPAMLARQLRIPATQARGLYAALLQNGVVRAPLAGSVARASKPLYRNIQSTAGNPSSFNMRETVDQLGNWHEKSEEAKAPSLEPVKTENSNDEFVRDAQSPEQFPDHRQCTS